MMTILITGRNKKPNRAGRTEPNRILEFRNRPEPDAEPNRTEPDRATTRPKSAGRTVSNRGKYSSEPNRTEPINFRKVRNRHESNRTRSLPDLCLPFRPLPYLSWPITCGNSTGLHDPTLPRLPSTLLPLQKQSPVKLPWVALLV